MKRQTYKQISYLLALLFISILSPLQSLATHIRAGDLTLRRTNDVSLEYEATVILYRDVTGVQAGEGLVDFGDGTESVSVSPRSLGFTEDGETEIIQYTTRHTFPSSGKFKVSYFERNRNPGVRNMEISSETPFFIQSEFMINPVLGLNSSPFLLIPPVIKGAVGQRFIHNAGAYDVDGDSLSYRLTVCLQGKDTPVQNYRFPDDPNEEWSKFTEQCAQPALFYIDEITGDLIWDTPFLPGEYNVAFFVEEWRDGIKIGAVNRDMQVIITDPLNLRPIIEPQNDTCVVVGSDLFKTILAYDQDQAPCYNPDSTIDWGPHPIELEIAQKSDEVKIVPYSDMNFNVTITGSNQQNATGQFSWSPKCTDVRQQPYKITFEAKDKPQAGNTQLGTLENWNVTVIGAAPENLQATPSTSAELAKNDTKVSLSWDAYNCSGADEIYIYRKIGSLDFNPVCETGLPSWTGYQYVGKVDATETTFTDRTVSQGANYCYRIYATFSPPGGGESIASLEACAFIPDSQYIVNVDVDQTGTDDGRINLKWTVPLDVANINTVTYNIYRAEGDELLEDGDYVKLNGSPQSNQDTSYVDNLLNTEETQYQYRIELLENNLPTDTTYIATNIRLKADAGLDFVDLTWNGNVPWNLTPDSVIIGPDTIGVYHYIYRKIEGDEPSYSLYDSVFVNQNGLRYTDRGNSIPLDDKKLYSYYVSTYGSFEVPFLPEPLVNRTQEITVELLDTIPPCPPVLTLKNYESGVLMDSCVSGPSTDGSLSCEKDRFTVKLSWLNDLSGSCDDDIVRYNVYFSPRKISRKSDFGTPYDTFEHPAGKPLTSTILYDMIDREYVAGVYAVTAVDDSGNESELSNIIEQDNCVFYEMPNAFSPNNDGFNDTLIPMRCPRFTKSIRFSVINRWGQVIYVYDSEDNNGDIEINWDGKDRNGNEVEPGNYYYQGELVNYRLNESDEKVNIKGSFVILRGKDSSTSQ
ncbi:T9SS type B sorting domain-containing protein [Flammeovirga kamogawensis]|uniref:Gliding motility-associated C-terminal domain-containing protein n=1 Tax=Flammeovirga kamogawensis TaxID=373891 RepID=A0ABX8GZU6_9BACT|nr:gliding motility-associated C-terminal domain-containing protein [Flammeovirga kamogawensis]MBB6459372.1 gliding motility-associated-like protein [Flammeovirga kamogawensis]QWG08929.1 gliding motility-associated C-terminal domain-containing protein [Flammeovirga kamogawensis]TRX67220.1 hypothetical protein EO216_03340 [Flammeovirga kamogawensis]